MTTPCISAPWAIFDVDIAHDIHSIETGQNQKGMGLLIRYKDKPVAFAMIPLAPGTILHPKDILKIAGKKAGNIMCERHISEELKVPVPHGLPSLTVAICTHNRSKRLARCLNSLTRIHRPRGFNISDLEILVVDNAPPDRATFQVAADYQGRLPNLRYMAEHHPGLDFARNRAIQEASGTFLAYLDDDVTVDSHWLEGLMEAWQENPDATAFTGAVLPYALDTKAQIFFEMRGGFQRGFEKIRYGQKLPGNPLYPCGSGIFGAGCNMAFKTDLLKTLGGFDEALDRGAPLPGGGDLDIFYRVIRSGQTLVYEPGFMVFHEHRKKIQELKHQYFTWGLGFMAFVWKSWKHDKKMKQKLVRLVDWWFKDQFKRIGYSLFKPGPLPLSFILAEIWGGIVGLAGTYPRSQKQIRQWQTRRDNTRI